jgi:hypothetical protein
LIRLIGAGLEPAFITTWLARLETALLARFARRGKIAGIARLPRFALLKGTAFTALTFAALASLAGWLKGPALVRALNRLIR